MNITIFNPHKYKFDKEKTKKAIQKIFKKNNISDNTEVSVALVNHKEMANYAEAFLNEKGKKAESHPVLSFLTSEIKKEFIHPPDNKNHIGEIIISFDKAKEYAEKNISSIDHEIAVLAEHAALHLCGIHHD